MHLIVLLVLILVPLPGIADSLATKSDVVVVVGIEKEAKLAEGENILTIISGTRPAQLEQLLSKQDFTNVRAIVSFGVAGGLDPEYQTGDVVVPKEIVFGDNSWGTDPLLRNNLISQLRLLGLTTHDGVLTGADKVIPTPYDKARLRELTGASAVDMESHIAARYAATNDIPFIVLRVISDDYVHALPSVTHNSITARGRIRMLSVLLKTIRHPKQIPALKQTKRDADHAFSILAVCRSLLLL